MIRFIVLAFLSIFAFGTNAAASDQVVEYPLQSGQTVSKVVANHYGCRCFTSYRNDSVQVVNSDTGEIYDKMDDHAMRKLPVGTKVRITTHTPIEIVASPEAHALTSVLSSIPVTSALEVPRQLADASFAPSFSIFEPLAQLNWRSYFRLAILPLGFFSLFVVAIFLYRQSEEPQSVLNTSSMKVLKFAPTPTPLPPPRMLDFRPEAQIEIVTIEDGLSKFNSEH